MYRTGLAYALLAICGANAVAQADPPRDVDWLTVYIDCSYSQGSDTPIYEFDADVGTETASIVGGTVATPAGSVFSLSYDPDEPEWGYYAEHSDAGELSVYGDGVYTFSLDYSDGSSATTTLNFVIPGSGDPIGQPTHKPILTSPVPGASGVPAEVTYTWEPVIDDNVNLIELLVSYTGYSPNDEVFGVSIFDPDTTSYGPATMDEGVLYDDCHLDFLEKHYDENADGIPCNFAKLASVEFSFQTVPEPAMLGFLALGGLAVLRRSRTSRSA